MFWYSTTVACRFFLPRTDVRVQLLYVTDGAKMYYQSIMYVYTFIYQMLQQLTAACMIGTMISTLIIRRIDIDPSLTRCGSRARPDS